MALSEREQDVYKKIKDWERQLHEYDASDFEKTYDKLIERSFNRLSPTAQEKFYSLLDNWLFHLHALLQGSQFQIEARQRIINTARLQYPHIHDITDLRSLPIEQLVYIAEQEIAKHRLYSFAQGGLTGTGGILLLSADIPLMTIINLRIVQLLSLIYGYEVNAPYEMMTSLKVFHASTLPKRLQRVGWNNLIQELEEDVESSFWYGGNDQLTDETWIDLPLKQMLKATFILMFRRKLYQGIPLIGVGIGAGMNYSLTRQVTQFAHHYYQLRYLSEREDWE
ncbi:EcsC family protein [Bacillus salitolerans]|uniref:EcsC family protein n=1 Tax=Bacillus salitolerans TaxID=1437434 RepID=A0ABW4LW09_9BACI